MAGILSTAIWIGALLLAGCGTPQPIPTPIAAKAVALSSTNNGQVVVAGRPLATKAATVRVVNQRTQATVVAKVDSVAGSFAALVAGSIDDPLALFANDDVAPALSLTVPKSSGAPPLVEAAPPGKDGRSAIRGSAAPFSSVWISLLAASRVEQVPVDSLGAFGTSMSVKVGDELWVFTASPTAGSSLPTKVTIAAQLVNPMCIDSDSDGFGLAGTDLSSCSKSTTQGDCHDGDQNVRPDQTQFSATAVPGVADPNIDFDFDCDGKEELEFPTVLDCAAPAQGCNNPEGWKTALPGCGATGTWIRCVQQGKTCVEQAAGSRAQRCR